MSKTRDKFRQMQVEVKRTQELTHWVVELSYHGRRYRHGNGTWTTREYAVEYALTLQASSHFQKNFAGWKITVYKLECNEWINCGTIPALSPDETPIE